MSEQALRGLADQFPLTLVEHPAISPAAARRERPRRRAEQRDEFAALDLSITSSVRAARI
jgi:hypothetical protein